MVYPDPPGLPQTMDRVFTLVFRQAQLGAPVIGTRLFYHLTFWSNFRSADVVGRSSSPIRKTGFDQQNFSVCKFTPSPEKSRYGPSTGGAVRVSALIFKYARAPSGLTQQALGHSSSERG